MNDMDLVELASGMSPTGCFVDASGIEVLKARISIGLQGPLKGAEVLPGMLALTIFRVREPDCWRSIDTGWPNGSDIGPEATGSGLAVPRCKYGKRGVIGVQLGAGEHMLLDGLDERAQEFACCADQPAIVEREISTSCRA